MAYVRYKYDDLNQTLRELRRQVIDSIDYVCSELPSFSSPEQMFNWCRMATTYKFDPKGVELLQSVPTLFSWFVDPTTGDTFAPGEGDCDCFTILTLTCCICNGWNENFIVLCGRNKRQAVHIYSAVVFNGQLYTLDLTNPYINMERHYKYRQWLEC